jgi:hypothetical protein
MQDRRRQFDEIFLQRTAGPWSHAGVAAMPLLGPLAPRLCCKTRKLQASRFFAKTIRSERPLIRMTLIALPKSPVNFAGGREAPRILLAKVAPPARRILVIG